MEIIRLVGVIRQSKFKGDQAISEESQRMAINAGVETKNRQAAASGKRFEIIGWAIDIGVSADKYDPWKRPQLGAWLKKPEAWDGMISMKLDRIARNVVDFAKLMQMWDEYGKTFLCSDDPMDLTTDMGRAFSVVWAVIAELELKGIKTRNKNVRKALNEAGRWTGGHVPFGRVATKTHEGVKLTNDSKMKEVLDRTVDRFYDGESYNAIAEWLNKEDVPTSRTAQERRKGKQEKSREWSGDVVSRLLRSRHLIGHKEVNGVVLRDASGQPLVYCEPLMKVGEWNKLQRKMDERAAGSASSRRGTSLARKVGGCLDCLGTIQLGSSAPQARPNLRPRYRCATISARRSGRTKVQRCENGTITRDEFDAHLERSVLDAVGRLPRVEKVYMPGEDHTEDLEQTDDAITSLQKERDLGLIRSEEEYFSRLKALMERRNTLLELPHRPAGWSYQPTGETVAEYWESMDTQARNLWLQEMGVRLFYSNKGDTLKWRLVLGDLEKLPLLAQGAEDPQP